MNDKIKIINKSIYRRRKNKTKFQNIKYNQINLVKKILYLFIYQFENGLRWTKGKKHSY